MTAVQLRRIDPTRNMRRFYRLDIEPDLFGGVRLVKAMGTHRHGRPQRCGDFTTRSPCRRRHAATRRAQTAARVWRFPRG